MDNFDFVKVGAVRYPADIRGLSGEYPVGFWFERRGQFKAFPASTRLLLRLLRP